MTLAIGAAMTSACIDPSDDQAETLSDTPQASFVVFGNIYQNGTVVSFDDVTGITGINMATIVGLTACDPKALYAVEQDTSPPPLGLVTYSLWFSNSSGQSWTRQTTPGKSREIACDHAQLATLDANKQLWVASLQANGVVHPWAKATTTVTVDRIQGGDGSIYGVKRVASGMDVYVASAKSINAALDWGAPIANIGATQVTGTGLTRTGTDNLAVGNTLAWSRRAFALEANGAISTNSKLLDGNNLWASLDSGSERYLTLTAAAPNILFGIQNKSGVNHINRIRIDETNCTDGIDNDANGLTDGEDPACTQAVAYTFCTAQPDGYYCANRFQPSSFLDQPNQNASLVHCAGHSAVSITLGVCVRNPNTSVTNADSLQSLEALTPADPPNTGHYCNVHWPDGTWGFNWTGATPCTTLLNSKPNARSCAPVCTRRPPRTPPLRPVRMVGTARWARPVPHRCRRSTTPSATPPISASSRSRPPHCRSSTTCSARRTSCRCRARPIRSFTTSPRWTSRSSVTARSARRSASIGSGSTKGGQREPAYDNPIDEGRPVYAVGGGIVIPNGSRIRDVSQFGCGGTPNQGELYVKYSVGSDATYRESFVVYYAHVRKRLVVDGQTVKAGQILGYTGAMGCAGGFGHLHTGVFRLSNTNAHTTTAPEAGYHMNFQANLDNTGTSTGGTNSIDPLGWGNYAAFDPWAYAEWNTSSGYGFTGKGAWSVDLFKSGKEFRYP